MRIALAPINPTVGDVARNADLVRAAYSATRDRVDVVVLPELAISGYPPRDLLLEPGFLSACRAHAWALAEATANGPVLVVGCPTHEGAVVRNSVLVLRDGGVQCVYHKRLLPTYDVFDEDRYFEPGGEPCVIDVGGRRLGLAICEDLWMGEDAGFASRYEGAADPVAELVAAGASVVVAPSASPFVEGKHARHEGIVRAHAERHGVWVLGVNQAGGNDDLIFDGHAIAVDPAGALRYAGARFGGTLEKAETTIVDVDDPGAAVGDPFLDAGDDRTLVEALVVGVRDYCRKTGFARAIIGLSGGIDSAVTAAIAVLALGPENVLGVAMPGPYSSAHSMDDALALAQSLGVRCPVAPIAPPMEGFRGTLDELFAEFDHARLGERLPDVTEENLQSRLRGTMLMSISNRTGAIVLTTGNKSELAVGYCTLYGDMNGGLAVLADVPKTRVYAIARHVNVAWSELGFAGPPIPRNTIDKPPSAELAPDQRDDDTLPPYDVLDRIVEMRVERRMTVREIAGEGFDREQVDRIAGLIARNEYKRRQAAIALKVTSVAFGPGRRMPIAQAWLG
ncbi:MAG: NAD+ synthase [Planctomycetota bacterium]